ncbi:molybdopterin-dependent oxidoreductase [Stieleria sp. ICT_E10.1]|uniref:xanthine dehydrogenase family protein molybdopterin-binding subunit n=1 Tax=Stieleria sedimenti TaxID=2976331 RepID=UPI00217F4A8B|nr:molybdopterin cofactor-binding domain-containing protein [Stieleria sedimenti]MCS7468659.1 molybdopterin-dependent oxidoreductase [Stieleria sedimenti]
MDGKAEIDLQANGLKLSRREWLTSLLGGLIVLARPASVGGAVSPEDPRLEVWLHVGSDGIATGFTGKVEYGQSTRTGFIQVIAEELDLPLDRVQLIMGDTDRVPFDAGTYASMSTEMMRPRFRRAGSRARVLLQRRAAERWGVSETHVKLQGGRVLGPTGQSIDLGELVKESPLVDILEHEPEPKNPDDYRFVGKGIARVDGIQRVTGAAIYGTDFSSPGMLHGAVLRPPAWDARLVGLDASRAKALAGFVQTVRQDDFVGVVAETESVAHKAVDLLQARWERGRAFSDADIRSQLEAACPHAELVHEQGDAAQASNRSHRKLQAVYETAFVYHAALEPQAAWAKVEGGEAWVHASTQRPFGVRQQIAELLGLSPEKVHVTVAEIGGAFGRKNDSDAAREAALLSRAVGRPVRVVWTRKEDFTQSSFRPAARMEVEAGISNDGRLVSWDYCLAAAGGKFSSTRDLQSFYPSDFHRTRFTLVPSGVRIGSFRGLGSPINAFARESFIDELAYAAGIDPLTFRLRALGEHLPRLAATLRALAAHSNWTPSTAPAKTGHGFGLACCLYRDKTYVAQLAEVDADPDGKSIRVAKVLTAIDCGFVVNPEGVRKQAEGGVTMATSYSLGEAVQIEDAAVSNARFGRYPILSSKDAPEVQTLLVGQTENPSVGVGEPVTVPVAAAIANAYFDATGIRKRNLPLM